MPLCGTTSSFTHPHGFAAYAEPPPDNQYTTLKQTVFAAYAEPTPDNQYTTLSRLIWTVIWPKMANGSFEPEWQNSVSSATMKTPKECFWATAALQASRSPFLLVLQGI